MHKYSIHCRVLHMTILLDSHCNRNIVLSDNFGVGSQTVGPSNKGVPRCSFQSLSIFAPSPLADGQQAHLYAAKSSRLRL